MIASKKFYTQPNYFGVHMLDGVVKKVLDSKNKEKILAKYYLIMLSEPEEWHKFG